jgi:hypothetical protein
LKLVGEQPPMNGLSGRCAFWEIYSNPRIAPVVRQMGGQARRSVDKNGHWDLASRDIQYQLLSDVTALRPYFTMLSPPCTYFCQLMFSNWSRMDDIAKNENLAEAIVHLDVSVWIATFQKNSGAKYCLEHPQGAHSWQRSNVEASIIVMPIGADLH